MGGDPDVVDREWRSGLSEGGHDQPKDIRRLDRRLEDGYGRLEEEPVENLSIVLFFGAGFETGI